VIDSKKLSKAHWEHNLRQYAHHAEPLFDLFKSKESAMDALREKYRCAGLEAALEISIE